RERDCRAAAAAAAGLRLIVRVERSAKDGIVGLRSQAKLRDVCFPDNYPARKPDSLDHDRVRSRNKIFEQWRAHRGANAPGRLEILDRMRKAVHPAKMLAASQLRVASFGLVEQMLTRQKRNDRVDARVQAIDVIEIRVHHLDARDPLRLDRA